jgi:alpha-L-fucosidase
MITTTHAAEPTPDPRPKETPAQRDARMKWWREARFGMFIHWGLYAVPAGQWPGKQGSGAGEWIMEWARIPVADYEKLAPQFNPTKFNADEWVRIAKDTGMKYIVITSKHHDGFCLWDSKVSTYDVMDATPFKRDILRELADACKKQGVRLCFYHSIMDWHHPDAQAPHYPTYNTKDKKNPNFQRYVDTYLKPQLKELITGYDPGVLWFDGEWIPEWTEEMGKDLEGYCRSLKPDLIVNNRVGKGRQGMAGMSKDQSFSGDFGTPEQEIPPTGFPGVDWESCMTMNDTWGFKKNDNNWKSADGMIKMLADTASKGGNFLMNVGPTAEGEIPAASVERLAKVGQWMKANGDAIYGTTASPFKKLPWGRATQKPGRLYLMVFAENWPKDGQLRVPLTGWSGKLADRGGATQISAAGDEQGGTIVKIAQEPPTRPVTVLELQPDQPLKVIDLINLIKQADDGTLTLLAQDCEIEGHTARVEQKGNNPKNIGYWTNADDKAIWHARITKPGKYEVTVEYALDPGSKGAEYTIEFGDKQIAARPEVTKSWIDFRSATVGTVELGSGDITVRVRPTKKPGQAVLDLRNITLKLAGG